MIDLRSDTVTKPTPGMWDAMRRAELGDDVYGEDPTVNRLQEKVAALLGKEAALFVPSGSMSNQLAIKVHLQPGDELLCEEFCHIYNWEAGTPAIISGVTCRTVRAEHGIIELDQLTDKIRPINDHMVRTKLVCLENTHNHGGGRIFPLDQVASISAWARKNNLTMHLDGARLWNAIVATGVAAKEWAKHFDTVSVCFSKGLGTPLGSALVGPKNFVVQARRFRKIFGGAMRQAGVVAAAAEYAIENNIERLADDHRHAKILGEAIVDAGPLTMTTPDVHTNMVWANIDPAWGTSAHLAAKMKQHGVLIGLGGSHLFRVCTHLDVSSADVEQAADAFRKVARHPVAA